jgi:hypothetical protein
VGNGRCAICFGWDYGNSTPLLQSGAQGVIVESFVGDESLEIDACDVRWPQSFEQNCQAAQLELGGVGTSSVHAAASPFK